MDKSYLLAWTFNGELPQSGCVIYEAQSKWCQSLRHRLRPERRSERGGISLDPSKRVAPKVASGTWRNIAALVELIVP
eukprot:2401021-Pyramimonas_sp.AAC.1